MNTYKGWESLLILRGSARGSPKGTRGADLWNLEEAYLNLGRVRDATQLLAEAGNLFPSNDAWPVWHYLAFLQDDRIAMKRILKASSGSSTERQLSCEQFWTETYYGHLKEGREFLRPCS